MFIKIVIWAAYAVFAVLALYPNWRSNILALNGPLATVKFLVWASLEGSR